MKLVLKPRLVLLIALTLFCAVLGWGWLQQTPSFEELQGDTVRATEYYWAMKSVGGWAWWTPNYLLGHSHAFFGACFLSLIVFVGLSTLLSGWLQVLTVFKLIGLSLIFLGGLSMYGLARRLFRNEWTAVFCGFIYAASAQFAMRTAMLEHISTAACMVFAPLILSGLLRCEKNNSPRSIFLLAISVLAMVVCYIKIFLLFLPAAVLFVIWRFVSLSPEERKNLVSGCFWGAVITIPMALLPFLPLIREGRFLAGFELEPFTGWQHGYSFFSAISWVDYWNILTNGSSIGSFNATRHPSVDFYLGGVALLGIFLGLYFGSKSEHILKSSLWRIFRFLCLVFLFGTWLSSGPRSLIQSHFVFLTGAIGIPNASIAVAWLLFVAQGYIIWKLLQGSRLQLLWAIVAIAVYFFVPGFRLLEFVPLYRDIRAPSATWTAFGTLFTVLAAGAGWQILAGIFDARKWRVAGISIIVVLLAADMAFLHRAFFQPGLPAETFTDFEEAQSVLAEAGVSGSVFCISGRYFYLTTPKYSGRAVATEALMRHLQPRWIRHMESRGQTAADLQKAYFDFFGIAYFLLDRKDPDTPEAVQSQFEKKYPTIFQNEYFTILENKNSLAPAYLSRHVIRGQKDSFLHGEAILALAKLGFVTVESEQGPFDGKINEEGFADIAESVTKANIPPPERLKLQAPRTQNYHSFTVDGLPADAAGIVVATEVYHPDWQAKQNGVALPVRRAMGALLSVQVEKPGAITFLFTPPWWYNACMWASVASWVASLGLLGFLALPFAPVSWRRWWQGITPVATEPPKPSVRPPIQRPIVIIPTWNEREGIEDILAKTLEVSTACHVLIVDDNSPDGTAGLVKAHPSYGTRVFLLERAGKLGLGSAYREGFQWAIDKGYDACIEMDADLSHNPADIPSLIATLDEGTDAAIGSRYLNGVRVMNWPEHRLLLSTMASRYVRLFTSMPLTDSTSGFKALRVTALKQLDPGVLKAEGYAFQIELHHALWRSGMILKEIPIVFTERRVGQTKMNIGIALEAFLRVLQLSFSNIVRVGHRNPSPAEVKK